MRELDSEVPTCRGVEGSLCLALLTASMMRWTHAYAVPGIVEQAVNLTRANQVMDSGRRVLAPHALDDSLAYRIERNHCGLKMLQPLCEMVFPRYRVIRLANIVIESPVL